MDRVDIDKIVDFLAAETSTPFIEVSRCAIDDAVGQLIPLEQSRRMGILTFGRLGKEVMVVVMNPVDKEMRKTLSTWLNTRIHCYLTSPDEFQAAWENLRTQIQKRQER